jgi:hypothetical protein
MATDSVIAPFPADIDRTAFGHWLSGLADGEGCFVLASRADKSHKLPTPLAVFTIKLRDDDSSILHLIRSYWQCGYCNRITWTSSDRPGTKPACAFRVTRVGDLLNTVVAHFDKHPLRSKKAADYFIWRQGVEFFHSIAQRKRRIITGGPLGRTRGTLPRWTDDEKTHYLGLVLALQKQRKYQ